MTDIDVAIVGAGTAGMTAAIYAKRSGLAPVLFEEYMPGGQIVNTGEIENYPALGKISGFDYSMALLKQTEAIGVRPVHRSVSMIERREGGFKLVAGKEEYFSKALIIATGAKNRLLGAKGEQEFTGRGISYCATCDGAFYRDRKVAVVGGGNTAAEDALYLSKLCKKVYIVHRRDRLRASAAYQKQLEQAENVEFVWNSHVTKLIYDNVITGAEITNRVTGEKSELDANGIFIAVGRIPNNALFKDQIELDEEGYAAADETTKTNIPGVFAAGDIRRKPLRQIVTAASDGAVASKFVEEYLGLLP